MQYSQENTRDGVSNECCEVFKNTYFEEHLRTAVSTCIIDVWRDRKHGSGFIRRYQTSMIASKFCIHTVLQPPENSLLSSNVLWSIGNASSKYI